MSKPGWTENDLRAYRQYICAETECVYACEECSMSEDEIIDCFSDLCYSLEECI